MCQAGKSAQSYGMKTNHNATAGGGTDHTDRLPKRLSPSRALDYMQCPAKFYFKSILRMPSTPTVAQARGIVAHTAMEKIFDHERPERTMEKAVSYVAPAWEELRGTGGYDNLDGDEVVADATAMVRAWFGVEDPTRFDPAEREVRLGAEMSGVPVIGVIDRVDRMTRPTGEDIWVISDYKTGKVPKPDDRYIDQKFFGLEVYAALWHSMTGTMPAAIRLIYVAGGSPDSVRTRECTPQSVEKTTRKLRSLWKSVTADARNGSFACRTGPLCNWCDFQQTVCPAWNEGAPAAAEDR